MKLLFHLGGVHENLVLSGFRALTYTKSSCLNIIDPHLELHFQSRNPVPFESLMRLMTGSIMFLSVPSRVERHVVQDWPAELDPLLLEHQSRVRSASSVAVVFP